VQQPHRRRRFGGASRVREFRGDIEGLRAVAVLAVVAFHAGLPGVRGGFVGVDVFFVLSGFLITGLLLDELAETGRVSLTEFYARRIRRLLPLATLVLAATAAATYALVPPIDRGGVGGDIVAAALWVANWRFAAESTQYMADTDKSPLLHYWSLSVEEQFYVVWPLLILLVAGGGIAVRAWPVAARRVGLVLTLLAGGSLALSVATTAESGPFAYFGLHTRAWELAAGGLLALARPSLSQLTRRAARGGTLLGALLVTASVVFLDESTPFPGAVALVPVAGAVLLVAGGARIPDEGVPQLLAHRVPRYIGRISYAWYLWHWPCLVLANARWPQAADTAVDGATVGASRAPWAVLLAAVGVSFVLAVASHYVVEQPLRSWAFLRRSRRRSLRFGIGLVATSVLAAAALVSATFVADRQQQDLAGASSEVSSAVEAASSEATPTVARVSMTPQEARDDTPGALNGCHVAYQPTTALPTSECRLGPARGRHTVALIGDSHAMQWAPALAELANRQGWTVYVYGKSACTVSDVPVWSSGLKREYTECARWRSAVLERLRSLDHLDAVVVGRWMDYRGLALDGKGRRIAPDEVSATWRAGFARTVQALAPVTSRVLVIRDTPRPGQDVPTCLSREAAASACAFGKDIGTGLDAGLAAAEKAAAPATVGFVDLTSSLCPAEKCPVVAPTGHIMFRDGHHLTKSYSQTLAQPLGKAIEAALKPS